MKAPIEIQKLKCSFLWRHHTLKITTVILEEFLVLQRNKNNLILTTDLQSKNYNLCFLLVRASIYILDYIIKFLSNILGKSLTNKQKHQNKIFVSNCSWVNFLLIWKCKSSLCKVAKHRKRRFYRSFQHSFLESSSLFGRHQSLHLLYYQLKLMLVKNKILSHSYVSCKMAILLWYRHHNFCSCFD